MNVIIKSREALSEMGRRPFPPGTAIISITDTDLPELELDNLPEQLLRLKFDDVSQEVYRDFLGRKPSVREMEQLSRRFHMFSHDQAKSIAEFVLSLYGKIDTLICQCEYGQSRSAAVAAAILEYYSHSGIEIFAAESYCPNKLVYKRLLQQLNQWGGRRQRAGGRPANRP